VFRDAVLALGALTASGCASAPRTPPVDLEPARAAVMKAREAGAGEKAGADLARAEKHLKAAEAAAARPDEADTAACLTEMAAYEAECALRLVSKDAAAELLEAPKDAPEAGELQARLRKAEEDHRQLEERNAVLLRDLDLTETEVIRTKAKLQGLETKADATSVIAETRVLYRRALQQRGRTPSLLRCEELLNRAETMVEANNHGAAVFMALKVQELLKDARRAPVAPVADRETEQPAPKKLYTVVAETANLRRDPSRNAPVVQRLKKGTSLEATRLRGDWLQVRAGEASGWIARALVE
jgi:hypothetical protein